MFQIKWFPHLENELTTMCEKLKPFKNGIYHL